MLSRENGILSRELNGYNMVLLRLNYRFDSYTRRPVKSVRLLAEMQIMEMCIRDRDIVLLSEVHYHFCLIHTRGDIFGEFIYLQQSRKTCKKVQDQGSF